MKAEFFKNNRNKLLNYVKDNSIVILFAGNAPKKTGDEAYPFTPNRNFYYLTGITQPNVFLVIVKDNEKHMEILYIDEYDEMYEKHTVFSRLTKEYKTYESYIIDELLVDSGLERIKIISPDGPADFMRPVLNAMDEETFELFVKYHLSVCERADLIGAGSHTLDILKNTK